MPWHGDCTAGDEACARLLASAPTDDDRRPLLAALDEAMRGRSPEAVAPVLRRAILSLADREPGDVTLTRLSARLETRSAVERARTVALDSQVSEVDRLAMLDLLGELKDSASVGLLLDLGDACDASADADPVSRRLKCARDGSRTTRSPGPCWPPTRGRTTHCVGACENSS